MTLRNRIVQLTRASEWWEHKLVPAVAVFYMTAWRQGATLDRLVVPFLALVAALAVGGAFVGLLNDLTDADDDRRAGKPDRGGNPRWAHLAVTLALGGAIAWFLRAVSGAVAVYLAGWLLFAAYSLPPVRAKRHPVAGVLCDAAGAHLVPALLAVALAGRGLASAGWPWLAVVSAWSLAAGLRGIVTHQLADEAFDRASGLCSLAVALGAFRLSRLTRHWLFPFELAALGAMLLMLGSPVPLLALAAALLFLLAKIARYDLTPVVSLAAARPAPVLADFYEVFLPWSLLAMAAVHDARSAVLIPVHAILFPARVLGVLRDLFRLPREVLS